jgi:hypothetical protein
LGAIKIIQGVYQEMRGAERRSMSAGEVCFKTIEVLAMSRSRDASDSHDKIHGLLGLFSPTIIQMIDPIILTSNP